LAKRYQRREGFLLLSIVGAYLRKHGHQLTVEQIRSAWGQRLFDVAANLYHNKQYGCSAPFFWRAAYLGFRPFKSLINVGRATVFGILSGDAELNLRSWQEGLVRATVSLPNGSDGEGRQN